MLRFEWDDWKALVNQKKHGVTFDEAHTVFFDDHAIEFDDPDHSEHENRFLLIGRSFRLRILVVCHCLRKEGAIIRLISARRATRREQKVYARRGKP